ncbi:Halomucin [Folsomia candida]|uniref:Halomucin n=1 Tax=Folsomia candida TaxID=158441 RepID=A0A226EM74_FOLCA|nr:Halomucin [Folsomia candida]
MAPPKKRPSRKTTRNPPDTDHPQMEPASAVDDSDSSPDTDHQNTEGRGRSLRKRKKVSYTYDDDSESDSDHGQAHPHSDHMNDDDDSESAPDTDHSPMERTNEGDDSDSDHGQAHPHSDHMNDDDDSAHSEQILPYTLPTKTKEDVINEHNAMCQVRRGYRCQFWCVTKPILSLRVSTVRDEGKKVCPTYVPVDGTPGVYTYKYATHPQVEFILLFDITFRERQNSPINSSCHAVEALSHFVSKLWQYQNIHDPAKYLPLYDAANNSSTNYHARYWEHLDFEILMESPMYPDHDIKCNRQSITEFCTSFDAFNLTPQRRSTTVKVNKHECVICGVEYDSNTLARHNRN